MPPSVKICGLCDAPAVTAAAKGGARYVGFVFYPPSPRCITAQQAAGLIALLPTSVTPVGLFVNASDADILQVLNHAPLRMLQLHGNESVERVAEVNRLTGLPVIKAVGIATAQDVETARAYETVCAMLLLDAKAPAQGLPGGNARTFDWKILEDVSFAKPWMLAGGLTAATIAQAVVVTGARILDVSSGVEDAVGCKNPAKITAFLNAAKML